MLCLPIEIPRSRERAHTLFASLNNTAEMAVIIVAVDVAYGLRRVRKTTWSSPRSGADCVDERLGFVLEPAVPGNGGHSTMLLFKTG